MIIALKLLIVVVWIGAGVSKFVRHFSRVVPPMVSNTPWAAQGAQAAHYRDFPNDLRPSQLRRPLAHVGGTTVEIILPLVLLFSHQPHRHACRRRCSWSASTCSSSRRSRWRCRWSGTCCSSTCGVPVLGPPGVARLRGHRLHVPAGAGARSSPDCCFPRARQPAARPGVVPALDAPVRGQLGVGDVGVRARGGSEAQRAHRQAAPSRRTRSDQAAAALPRAGGRNPAATDCLAWRSMHSQGPALNSMHDQAARRRHGHATRCGRPSSPATRSSGSTSVTAISTTST